MLDSEHIRSMAELGFIAATQDDNANGMAIAQGLQALREEHAVGYIVEALCHMNQHDWLQACKSLEKGLKVEPTNSMAWVTLTQAKKQLGDTQGAKRAVNELEKLGAKEEWALSNAILLKEAS